jgi:hypothetical protein
VIKAKSTAGLSWGTVEIVGKELVNAVTTERMMAPNKATPMPTERYGASSPVKISMAYDTLEMMTRGPAMRPAVRFGTRPPRDRRPQGQYRATLVLATLPSIMTRIVCFLPLRGDGPADGHRSKRGVVIIQGPDCGHEKAALWS